MKKFTFELQKILEYRDFERKQAEAELAKCIAVENQINEQMKQLAIQYAASKDSVRGSLNFQDIMSHSQFSNLINYQKEELSKELAQAKLVTEEKRNILRECIKKTTALEKLRERQLAEYKEAESYEEAEIMDDLATTRHKNNY
ncbi:MAG: flagellar export protein FliJ [Treponema sp.]|nr:flagellar export protein FliJ [Treponema sp.]